jgi:hypothetical protein
MRAVITSSKSWSDEKAVVDALYELPTGAVVLLPMSSGACKFVRDNIDNLKFEIEDWSEDDEFYERQGGAVNSEMLQTDIDICFAFISKDSYTAKDCVRRARNMDLEVRVVER